MRKSKLIYIMAIVILLTGCKQKQENRIEIPAYILNTNYECTPVKAIPLGEYKTIVADEGNTIFVGTDPKIIPTGTFLFIHNVGMRVAAEDKTAKGKMIVFYEPAPETVFIYAIVKNKSEKGTPYYKELQMAKSFSDGFYHSKLWEQARREALRRDDYTCCRCYLRAREVHHIEELTPENINDPMVSLNLDNLESLCHNCHTKETKGCDGDITPGYIFDDDGQVILPHSK